MCHLQARPGDPACDFKGGIDHVIDCTRYDLHASQDGGVDVVMFSNEFSLLYLIEVEPITYTTMARVIGELKPDIQLPYGVNVSWDFKATIDVAVSSNTKFVREDHCV